MNYSGVVCKVQRFALMDQYGIALVCALFCLLLSSCGGGTAAATASGGAVVTPGGVASAANSVPIVVDNGPAGFKGSSINQAYVSVTVCRPGTSICQTIDHILLDTGSFGLRLISPGILNAELRLPVVVTDSGLAVAECVQFASGYQWGAVRQADVKMGGEVAAALPVHIIADPAADYLHVPGDCSSGGANIGSVAALGANGVLGVGLFKEDCGNACVSAAISGAYYACDTINCASISLPLAQQVSNPVASFVKNNNGVLLIMPEVPIGGVGSLTGSLIFGIDTQANNLLGSATIYHANNVGNITTTYNGKELTSSFLDSGSNGYFFDDKNIRACTVSSSFYCPLGPLTLNAINRSDDRSSSGSVVIKLESVDALSANITAAYIGGAGSGILEGFNSNGFDWGLPFFFGRRVFVAIQGANIIKGRAPYFAY
ncbi:DUF3443 domain-containing protein [soil metagenome]